MVRKPERTSKLRAVSTLFLCALAMILSAACSPETSSSETNVSAEGTAADEPTVLLPDIVPDPPTGVVVEPDESGNLLLAFDTQFANLGDGPLIIEAEATEPETMEARQSVEREDGSTTEGDRISGELHFERSEDHNHWHFFRFMRYELRDENGELVAPDQKTGFCVGDRYDDDPETRLEGEPDPPGVYDIAPEGDWCAEDDPGREGLTMGLSVGYGDNYAAFLEGQSIDVSGVPSGEYVLVNRVNADLEETDAENNAASLLISLDTEEPSVEVVEECPESESCG